MNYVMLDLQTLGTDSDAVICQIGACWFDNDGTIGETFACNVDVNHIQQYGFKYSGSAIQFWLKQPKEVQETLFDPKPIFIGDALNLLNEFMKGVHWVWSHSNFDFVIIQNAYKKMKIEPSFHYKTSADIRTLDKLAKMCGYKNEKEFVREGEKHNALSDCKFQVQYVTDMIRFLKDRK